MALIALTNQRGGKTVYVNPALVRLLIRAEVGEGTDVVFDGSHRITVNENIDSLLPKFRDALRG